MSHLVVGFLWDGGSICLGLNKIVTYVRPILLWAETG